MAESVGLLTSDEVRELTGKRRHKAQARALAKMGVRHVLRPDGSPVVARALVAAMLTRYTEPPAPVPQPERRIDWSLLRRSRPGKRQKTI